MAKTRQSKEQALATLTDQLQRMKALVFTHYQGLSVKDVTALRRLLRAEQIDFVVAKKTLLRRALTATGADGAIVDQLSGDVALAFGFGDEITPAKLLQTFAKTHPSVVLQGAVVQGQFLTGPQAVALSKLPGREELLARTVWVIKGPLTGLANVLSGPLRGLVNVLNAYHDTRPAPAG